MTFREDGFLLLPGAVRVEKALHLINAFLGKGLDPAQMATYAAQSYCPELRQHPELLACADVPFLAADAMIGNAVRPNIAQIALRFPKPGAPTPHIDGYYTPENGVPQGVVGHFTALLGVFLSDVPSEDCGNFTVWPGSHKKLEAYFQDHDPVTVPLGIPPGLDLGPEKQITAKAGDAIICHYQLAHGIAGNMSPHIRYALFYRVKKRGHRDKDNAVMRDIFAEWDHL